MKKIFFIFFLAWIFITGFGQNYHTIDSLKRILPLLSDSSRVDCLNELCNQYIPHYKIWHNLFHDTLNENDKKSAEKNYNVDSAEYFQKLAYEEATKINYIHGIAESLSYHGELEELSEKFTREEKFSREAIHLFRKTSNKNRLALTYENLSNALRSQSFFEEAISDLDTAYKIYQANADTIAMARVLSVTGTIYEERGDYGKAFELYGKAYELSAESLVLAKQMKDEWFIKWQASDMGGLFEQMEDYATALEYFRQAHQNIAPEKYGIHFLELLCLNKEYDSAKYYYKVIIADTSDERKLRFYLGSIGNYYYMQKEYATALSTFLRFLNYSKKFNDGNQTMYALIGIAKTHLALQNYFGALTYAQQSLDFARRAGSKRVIQDALQIIYNVYDHRQQTDSAYSYYKQYTVMKDSLLNNQITGKLTAFRSKQKSEQQIALLNKEKEIQVIQLQKQSLQNKMLIGGALVFLLVAFILWRNNRHKQRAYELIQLQKKETEIQKTKAEQTLDELKSTQSQLIQSEKMASLGELTAGIAHEIQNPLNFVNNFSEVSIELVTEMKQELQAGNKSEAIAIAGDISDNLEKVVHHGKRADSIVKGMLQHSRTSNGQKEMTDINMLADEYLRLSYQGLRAKKKSFNATIKTDFDENIGKINIIPQDVGRALLNLYNNAFYSVSEKKNKLGTDYEPVVTVTTKKIIDKIEIHVRDNGIGIPQKALEKIFQPFFTTKPAGQGTGLGLSLTYDVVTKEHGGTIKVETKEGEFAEFVILLPII
jgi:two-component system NtrC family sensor kinase